MIHWLFHKDHKLVQEKVLIENCWDAHVEMQKEANLVLMKDQDWFYQVAPLRLLGLITLRVKSL